MNINILFEDSDVLVIDKPSGLTVNKSDTTQGEVTLQDWSEDKLGLDLDGRLRGKKIQKSNGEPDYEAMNREAFFDRGGIVHRLDKETSGILLIAKNQDSFIELLRQFREREVKKSYTALIHGNLIPDDGEIRVPVGRLSWNRKRFGVVPGGRDSITKYVTLAKYKHKKPAKAEHYSLLELYPETGRTHQIRVHMKYANHPIVSDLLYGGRKTARGDRKTLQRLFLHASRISFAHPMTKKTIELVSDLPTDLQQFINDHLDKVVELTDDLR